MRQATLALQALACFLLLTPPAFAYIDPTAAGAAMQSLYVLMASGLMAVALVPQKIAAGAEWVKAKLRRKPSDAE